jgi:exopolysaccharide biosynthesis polyprenyl glycosylphosphotransferase
MLIVGDFVALLSAVVAAYLVRVNIDARPLVASITGQQYLKIFLILVPIWLLLFAALNLYRREFFEQKVPETGRLMIGSFIGVLLVIGYQFVAQDAVFPSRLVALYSLIGAFSLLFIERSFLRWFRKYLYRHNVGVQKVMLIGSTQATKTLVNILNNTRTSGHDIRAIVGRKDIIPKDFNGKHFSDINEALKKAEKLGVNTIIQTEFYKDDLTNDRILQLAQRKHIAYRFIPTHGSFFTGNHSVEIFQGFPVVAVHHTRLFGWQKMLKRGFDVLVSLLTLPFIAIFYVLFGLIIKITDRKGPILYKAKRVTRFGIGFNAYKFRTMYWKYCTVGNKTDEQIFKEMGREDLAKKVVTGDMQVEDDPRLMPIGRLLRAASLDELPQFLNVLRGYMSIVGPRAITPKDMKLYKDQGSLLLHVKTGITGLAQVSGRSKISYEERARLNLYYVQNWSFLLDIRIILRTFMVLLRRDDIR